MRFLCLPAFIFMLVHSLTYSLLTDLLLSKKQPWNVSARWRRWRWEDEIHERESEAFVFLMNRRLLRPFCFLLRGISALSSLFLSHPQHRAYASIHAPSFNVNDVYFRQPGRAEGEKKRQNSRWISCIKVEDISTSHWLSLLTLEEKTARPHLYDCEVRFFFHRC